MRVLGVNRAFDTHRKKKTYSRTDRQKPRDPREELGRGKELGEVCRQLEVSEAIYHRWTRQYHGAQMETVKRLKELEMENSRFKKLVTEQALDMDILKELNAKKW